MKPSTITQWLTQPAKFSEKDRKDAASLIKTFPYFVPTRYVEAAEHHKKQSFAPALMNMMLLYRGNWLLFHDFLQSSGGAVAASVHAEKVLSESYLDEPEEIYDEIDPTEFGSYEDPVEILADQRTEDELIADEILEEEEEEPFHIPDAEPNPAPTPAETVVPPVKEQQIQVADEAMDEEVKPEPVAEHAATVKRAEPESPIAKEDTGTVSIDPPLTKSSAEQKQKPADSKVPVEKRKEEVPLFYQHRKNDSLIQPIFTEDYFLHQGLHVSDQLSADHQQKEVDKSLMVVMSFSEWLLHFKTKGEREKEEQQDQKALKTMWQKEKLAAALEEENDEIPENVFEMAVNSITKEEDLASESLADIMVKQGKLDKAIDMYRKLSLRNPQKKTYFARKIDDLQKDKES